jgi:hypothetical protein
MKEEIVHVILKTSNPREKSWFIYERGCDLSKFKNFPFASGEEDPADHSIMWHPAYDKDLDENGEPIFCEDEIRAFCEQALEKYERYFNIFHMA